MTLTRLKWLLYILIFWCTSISAQVKLPGNISLNTDVHDFGDIFEGNPRVADFTLTNNSSEEVFMLRAVVPDDFVYRYSVQKILPGQSVTLRVKVNREKKGYFHEIVNVFSSADGEAFALHITGNIKYVDLDNDPACPDFNEPIEYKIIRRDFTVQVIDRASNKPIGKAKVTFDPDPGISASTITNQDGICRNILPVDLYDIQVDAPGYESSSQTVYIGKNTTSTIFLLDRIPGYQPDTAEIARNVPDKKTRPEPRHRDTTAFHPDTAFTNNVIRKIDKVLAPKPKPTPAIVDTRPDTTLLVKEKPGELPVSTYGPNNIVFLLDVSASMMTPERLPLVKIAMKKLLYSLRSIDRVSIVTYASGVKLVLPSTTADKKEEIAAKIDALQARGNTEGGKGIREAYKVATDNFIRGGNNEIVLATDGDFDLDKSNAALYNFIKHEASDGIIISVVGVGKIPMAIKQMQTIADKGQGSYIHIKTKEEALNVLVDEVKERSERK